MRHSREVPTLFPILLQAFFLGLITILLFRVDSNVNLIATQVQSSYFLNIEEHRGTVGTSIFAIPIYGNTLSAANREFDQQVSMNTPADTTSCPDCVFDLPDSSIFLLYKDIENSDGTSTQTLVRDTIIRLR